MRSKFKWIFTLFLALTMQFSFAQEKTITGVVSDATGPIPGANVVVTGTNRSTQTDIDGRYSISASTGEVIVFSYVGMSDYSATVGAANVINATLTEGLQIENVVVTALGIRRKENQITSSYSVVKNEELNQAANPNAVQALVGKVSGLQINTTSSNITGESRVVFRGARSMTGNNQALVVIDGAISSLATFEQIPPELIESVNAMKGAQGAALYGSDGVNGVIVVTTKKGSAGEKFAISFSSSIDITDIAYLPQRQLRYGQGWDGLHASQENGSWGPEFDGSLQPVGLPQADGTYVVRPYSPIKDNYKQFFKQGSILQNNISISGGSLEKGYVVFAANRNVTDFIVEGDELKRNTFLLKAGKKMGKWSIEGNFNYISESVRNSGAGLYDDLLQTPSNVPVEQFSHGLNQHHWTIYYRNPYWLARNDREIHREDKFAGIATLGYEFNEHISVSYLANLRMDMLNNELYQNPYEDLLSDIYGSTSNTVISTYSTDQTFNRRFYGDLLVNFNYDLTDDISFAVNVGNNVQDQFVKINQVGGSNLEIPGVYNYTNVLNPANASGLTNTTTRRRKISLFGSADLGYKNFLFLNVTGRNDWSSVFATSNNSFFYPSVGLSFVPTVAFPGLKGDILNYAKVLANYTKVGNDSGVGTYAINSLGTLGLGYPFNDANSYVQQIQATDRLIKPEFVTTSEVAINLGFLNDRITFDGAFYVQDTDDLITRTSISATSGLFNNLTNIGKMRTKGFELDLGFTPFKSSEKDGFRWDAKLNLTKYDSKIIKVSEEADEVSLRQPYDWVGVFAVEGEDFPMIKGTTYQRDDQGRIIIGVDGMPTVDPTMKNLGKVNPDYILGLNTTFTYKGIKLAATMDYRTGGVFYSDVKRNLSWTGQLIESAENRSGFIMPNSSYYDAATDSYLPNTSIVTGGGSTTNFINYYGSFYSTTGENLVIDATAFKLREVALSYTLPNNYIERTGLTAVTFGVHARNVFTWLPKENRYYNDPETSETTGNAGGLAFTDRYPVQQSYGFSVNLTF
ncbi:MAG TPA: SusC/RagA family TonB-linked outer membrane protein [Flavobacterium sp.]|jgi:TonB-linked SusC/RagA family outer membrane protein